jgi:hypothetical protein
MHPIDGPFTPSLENIMFAYLIEKLSNWFDSNEQRMRDRYLAGATDFAELERRIQVLNARD